MKALITKSSLLICLLNLLSFNALDEDERVFKNGDYWEVSSITIVDGQWLNYVNIYRPNGVTHRSLLNPKAGLMAIRSLSTIILEMANQTCT